VSEAELPNRRQEDQEPVDTIEDKTSPKRESMDTQTPMVRETRTVVYPAGQPSPQDVVKKNQSHPKEPIEIDMAGVQKKDYQFVQQLESLAGSPNAVDYQIVVLRKNPGVLGNYRFVCNKILQIYEVGTYHDIRGYVVQEFGGGTYEIRLIKPRGDVMAGAYDKIGSMIFVQDVKVTPPICDAFTMEGIDLRPVSPARVGPVPVVGAAMGRDPESEDIQSLVTQRRKTQLKHEIWEQDSQIADNIERREENRMRRKIEQDRAEQSAALEWQSRFDTQRSQHESSMVQVMANAQKTTTELIAQLTQNKNHDGGGIGPIIAALMTTMSKAQEVQIEMMRQQSEARREDSLKLAEIQAQSHKDMLTMVTSMSSKSEALADKLLAMRIESPDQRIEQILKAKEAGKSEAKEWFQMIEEVRANATQESGGGDEVVDWDPEAGALGNLTALAFRGLQRLLTGPAAGQAMQMVNRLLNKPAYNTQFTDREVAAAAQQMEPYLAEHPPVPRLPAPPVVRTTGFLPGQTAPAPLQFQVPSTPAGRPEPGIIYQTMEPTSFQVVQAQTPQIANHPQMEILPPESEVPPTFAAEAAIEPAETSEDRLRFHVNTMIEDCMADLQDQRHVHQWPLTAFEVLNKSFLDELARTRSEEEQVSLIKRYADPTLFQTWYQSFWRPGGTENFRKFCQGIQQLISLHMENNNASATIAS
jgi:hypothetical protein